MIAWQRNLIASGIAVGVLALAVLVIFRPAVVVGVDAGPLQHSLQGQVPAIAPESGRCIRKGDSRWRCSVVFQADPGSETGALIDYEVYEDALGCWHALLASGGYAGSAPAHPSGCIALLDL